MARNRLLGLMVLTIAAAVTGHFNAGAEPALGARPAAIVEPIGGGIGPDLITGAVSGTVAHWTAGGAVTVKGTPMRAYNFGPTHCNIGTVPVELIDGTTHHPIREQRFYRLHDGRFEHIGQSWLSYTFCASQQNICGACQPACGGCCSSIGVGCSNPGTANRQGSFGLIAPKDHSVNPVIASFVQAHLNPIGSPTIRGRVQVRETDLTLSLFPQSRFFVELHEIAPDDAAAGNDNNNASWRECSVNQQSFSLTMLSTGSGAPGGTVNGTNREEVAMFAWQEFDTNAGPQPNVPVTIVNADVPDDGRFILGHEVTNNDDGTWTYEYALMNYNSDRSAQAFTIPVPPGLVIHGIGFHDVDYHSYPPDGGSQYDLTDWTAAVDEDGITWSGAPFDENPNANALRWGTLYNFRFTANSPPQPVNAVVTLFKPGTPTQIEIISHGPQPIICQADLDLNGAVDGIDLGILLAQFFGPGSADLDGSGVVDGVDLGILLNNWGDPGCLN